MTCRVPRHKFLRLLKIFRINQLGPHQCSCNERTLRGRPVIYVTSIERLPICIMKCYKSVENVEPNGNIEMMYSSAQPAVVHIKATSVIADAKKATSFSSLFSARISKLMVDPLMGGNTQMYYLNGEIDYSTIVTEPRKDWVVLLGYINRDSGY